jgi:hypothetical protein
MGTVEIVVSSIVLLAAVRVVSTIGVCAETSTTSLTDTLIGTCRRNAWPTVTTAFSKTPVQTR